MRKSQWKALDPEGCYWTDPYIYPLDTLSITHIHVREVTQLLSV